MGPFKLWLESEFIGIACPLLHILHGTNSDTECTLSVNRCLQNTAYGICSIPLSHRRSYVDTLLVSLIEHQGWYPWRVRVRAGDVCTCIGCTSWGRGCMYNTVSIPGGFFPFPRPMLEVAPGGFFLFPCLMASTSVLELPVPVHSIMQLHEHTKHILLPASLQAPTL